MPARVHLCEGIFLAKPADETKGADVDSIGRMYPPAGDSRREAGEFGGPPFVFVRSRETALLSPFEKLTLRQAQGEGES